MCMDMDTNWTYVTFGCSCLSITAAAEAQVKPQRQYQNQTPQWLTIVSPAENI